MRMAPSKRASTLLMTFAWALQKEVSEANSFVFDWQNLAPGVALLLAEATNWQPPSFTVRTKSDAQVLNTRMTSSRYVSHSHDEHCAATLQNSVPACAIARNQQGVQSARDD